MRPRVRRLRDVTELLAAAEALEPRTTHLVAALLANQPRTRAVGVRDSNGIAGAIVLTRVCHGRWIAHPLVLRPEAAEPLARWLGRSPAWAVVGSRPDVDPIAPAVRRSLRANDSEVVVVDGSVLEAYGMVPDERTRLAGADDLDALVALYEHYELDYLPSRRTLRADLRRAIADGGVVVWDEAGQLLGAYRVEAATRRFVHWSHQTVDPAARGRGLGNELWVRAMAVTAGSGRVLASARHSTNPTPYTPETWSADEVDAGQAPLRVLRLRRRVAGVARLEQVRIAVEGRRERRSTVGADRTRWVEHPAVRAARPLAESFEQERARKRAADGAEPPGLA